LEVTNRTIADNAALNGGGISTFTQNGAGNTATTTLRNTIIAANSPNNLATGTIWQPEQSMAARRLLAATALI